MPRLAPALRAAAHTLFAAGELSARPFERIFLPVTEQEVRIGMRAQPANVGVGACFAHAIVDLCADGPASHRFRDVLPRAVGDDATGARADEATPLRCE